jgi:isopenicillin N synthase-like dioxygenase
MQPRSELEIPVIEIDALFGARSPARDRTDAAVMSAATGAGFFAAKAIPAAADVGPDTRSELLRVFTLQEDQIAPLLRQKFAPSNPNLYRGWFPLQRGFLTSKEGIDLGPDVAFGASVVGDGDPLLEATPLPPEAALPGWRTSVARYYCGMMTIGRVLMRSLARNLGLDERFFDAPFERGLSTLRLIRYPVRTDLDEAARANRDLMVEHHGRRCHITGSPHVDTGFLALLAQDGVDGLQARHLSGRWMDVPPEADLIAVNFGSVLECWSGGRIKATPHRVIGHGRERRSIPFFYEARADAEICPLPGNPTSAFEPFLYGDHLWRTTTQFVEFRGMEGLRKPRRPPGGAACGS